MIRLLNTEPEDMIGSGPWSGAPVASDHNLCVHFLCTETVNNMGYFLLECRSYLKKLGTLIVRSSIFG